MNLRLIRDTLKSDYTLGTIFLNDKLLCYTVEDAVRDVKIPTMTAIPYGVYQIIINFSPKFQKQLPLLLDVPNYTGVRIHSGNTSEDTDGCIIVGMKPTVAGVKESRKAMAMLQPIIQSALDSGEKVTIEITGAA